MSNVAHNQACQLIEIVGPPGVGKSTIYKALCKKWRPACSWTYQDALLAPATPSFLKPKEWIEYKYKAISGKKRAKSIPVDYGMDFISENMELADFCWAFLSGRDAAVNHSFADTRFRAAYFLFRDFSRYSALQKACKGKPCVIEEGFLQKSFLVQDNPAHGIEAMDEYLSLIPLPRGIIYINAENKSTICNRLATRAKTIASHKGKSEAELEVETEKWQWTIDAMLRKLSKQQVEILELNGEKAVDYNVQCILKYLETLSYR